MDTDQSKPLHVLIVEDYNLSAQYMSQALKLCNCRSIQIAESGEQAVEMARSQGPFDVVFVDLLMKGMGGIACISVLKSMQWSGYIVAMSANEDLRMSAMAAGADKFLHKLDHPVRDIVAIVNAVRTK
ncbi:CheY-like superfamily protein [Tribonema minus]|uniref:CheY-like superfamily protein n=1 Tax=Tribonema minus TaxID=303371 RepID=A0A836CFN8_9STRA|nr:CheY-like superfamily protein [Tribonema minus]